MYATGNYVYNGEHVYPKLGFSSSGKIQLLAVVEFYSQEVHRAKRSAFDGGLNNQFNNFLVVVKLVYYPSTRFTILVLLLLLIQYIMFPCKGEVCHFFQN